MWGGGVELMDSETKRGENGKNKETAEKKI